MRTKGKCGDMPSTDTTVLIGNKLKESETTFVGNNL